jgi:hypothetical protein
MVPTITVQLVTVATTITTQTLKQCITTAINTSLKRNPGSGPPGCRGGSPGGGGSAPGGGNLGGGPAANPNQYIIVPSANNVHMMGSLPAIFDSNCSYAKGFIEGIQKYIHLNEDIPGFCSPMKKITLVLTLMQGEAVKG